MMDFSRRSAFILDCIAGYGLTPKYQSVLYIDVRVVRDAGWASSAASIGAELEAIVIPRPMRNRDAIYIAATRELAVIRHIVHVSVN